MTINNPARYKFLLVAILLATLAAAPSNIAAQTRCDASTAIGHIKRVEGPRRGVVITRAGGGTLADPPSLTYVCPLDDIKIIGAAVAHVQIYGSTPLAVRSFSPWKPVRARSNGNMRQNIWAMVTDKFLPDLGRVETSQRLRGGPLEPTTARIPSVRTGVDMLPQEELGGVIRVPVNGELWLGEAQLRGSNGFTRTSRIIEGQDIIFDATGLTPGRFEIVASKVPTSRLPPPARTIGAFTLVAGKGPNLATPDNHPYTPEMVMGLRALWLADTHGAQHGLLAYQLATRARMEAISPATVTELVLKTLSKPATPATSTRVQP